MSVAKDLLAKFMGKFIRGATGDQITLRNMLSGEISLGPGVVFVEEALQRAVLDAGGPLNWEIRGAEADVVHVHVPWAQLSKRSVRVNIGELKVQVTLHDSADLEAALLGAGAEDAPPAAEQGAAAARAEPDAPPGFAARQRAMLLAAASKKRTKLATMRGKTRRLTDHISSGPRVTVGNLRISFFLAKPAGSAGPGGTAGQGGAGGVCGEPRDEAEEPTAEVEVGGFCFSPCTPEGRPTMELREAHGLLAPWEEAPDLPCGLQAWATRNLIRVDWGHLLMRRCGQLHRVGSVRRVAAQVRLLEGCAPSRGEPHVLDWSSSKFLGAYRAFEVGGAPSALAAAAAWRKACGFGGDSQADAAPGPGAAPSASAAGSDGSSSGHPQWADGEDEPDFWADLETAELRVLLAQLANLGHAVGLQKRWKQRQPWREGQVDDASVSTSGASAAPGPEPASTMGAAAAEAVGEEEDVDKLLKESCKGLVSEVKRNSVEVVSPQDDVKADPHEDAVQVGAGKPVAASVSPMQRPSMSWMSTSSTNFGAAARRAMQKAQQAAPGAAARRAAQTQGWDLVFGGWLLKRGKLRPLMDSWQERWCELRKSPDSADAALALLYYARRTGALDGSSAPEDRQFRGMVVFRPGDGTNVHTFEQADADSESVHVARRDFMNGFELLPGDPDHEGRTFFFATEEASVAAAWTSKIVFELREMEQCAAPETPIVQSLEDFLGEELAVPASSSKEQPRGVPGATLGDLPPSEGASGQAGPPSSDGSEDDFMSLDDDDEVEEEEEDSQEAVQHVSPSQLASPTQQSPSKPAEIDKADWQALETRDHTAVRCGRGRVTLRLDDAGAQSGAEARSLRLDALEFTTTRVERRPLSDPELVCLARLAGRPTCEAPRAADESTWRLFGGRPLGSHQEGSAQQLAASLHEGSGGRAATHLGHSEPPAAGAEARAPALQGRLEEAPDGAQQVEAWIRGLKVRRPTVPVLMSMKQVAEKVKPTTKPVPPPSGEMPPPEVSVHLQDCELEIPIGTKGQGLRVRLPGVLELESLEAVLETIAETPPCHADAAGRGEAAPAPEGAAGRGEAAPAPEGSADLDGASFRSVQSSSGEPTGD